MRNLRTGVFGTHEYGTGLGWHQEVCLLPLYLQPPREALLEGQRGGFTPHRVPNIPAGWLEDLVWADVRAFLADPGEVLERVREHMADEDDYAELEERRGSLKKRLAEAQAELNRLLNLYATGEIDAEWLTTHVRDREDRIDNLRLLIASVESDLAAREHDRLAAESAEAWLLTLRERIHEVEGDTPEAYRKRRELVKLLVEQITTSRDEVGRTRVEVRYRFGPPKERETVTARCTELRKASP